MPVGKDGPPPTRDEEEAAMRRWPSDLAGLRSEWSLMKERWQNSDARASALGGEQRHQRVDGEWSYVETLRHLVFVVDAWVGRVVLQLDAPYHREALPPTFLPDLSSLGVEVGAEVSFDRACQLHREAQELVDRTLEELDDEGLQRVCDQHPTFGFPPETTQTVLHCLQVVLHEEWAHHGFANRDLSVLEAVA